MSSKASPCWLTQYGRGSQSQLWTPRRRLLSVQPPAMSASQTCHGTRYYYYGATKIFKTNFILPFKVTGRLDVFPAVERGLLAVIFEGLHQSLHTWSWTLWPSFRFRLSRCSRRCRFNDCVTACWR